MKVRVVTDSTSDVAQKWIEQYDIRVVPAFIQFGEESYPDDGVAMPPATFYERLASSEVIPTTSSPPPGLNEQMLRDALQDVEHVVAITLTSAFSGINNVMRLSAENVDPERITVIDSGSLSMGAGWAVLAAAEAAAAGADKDEVLKVAHDTIARTYLYAGFDTFEYLRRGGRVSTLQASIGNLLQIKPVLKVKDAAAEPAGRTRTFKKLYPLIEKLVRNHHAIERLAFIHTNGVERLDPLKERLSDLTPSDWNITTEATTAIGAQVGPGAIGVALVEAKS